MSNRRYKGYDTSGVSAEVLEARKKLRAKFKDKTRTGGKGSTRRKVNVHRKTQVNDNKKLK